MTGFILETVCPKQCGKGFAVDPSTVNMQDRSTDTLVLMVLIRYVFLQLARGVHLTSASDVTWFDYTGIYFIGVLSRL